MFSPAFWGGFFFFIHFQAKNRGGKYRLKMFVFLWYKKKSADTNGKIFFFFLCGKKWIKVKISCGHFFHVVYVSSQLGKNLLKVVLCILSWNQIKSPNNKTNIYIYFFFYPEHKQNFGGFLPYGILSFVVFVFPAHKLPP